MKSQIKYISIILLLVFSNTLVAYSISFHQCIKEIEAIHSNIDSDCCSNDCCADDNHESESDVHFENASCCETIQYAIPIENIEKYNLQLVVSYHSSVYLQFSNNCRSFSNHLYKSTNLKFKKKSLAFLSIYRI